MAPAPPLFVASARAAWAEAVAAARLAKPPSRPAMRSAAAASLDRLDDSSADRLASTACLQVQEGRTGVRGEPLASE